MKSRLHRIEIRNFKAFRGFALDLEGRHTAGSRKPLNLYDGKWAVEVFQKQMLFDEISVDLSGLGKGNCNGNFPGDSRHNFDATGTIHQQLFMRDDLRNFDQEYEALPPSGSSC
jgi:hypothetical protein